jgi:hypothetical protein
VELDYGQLKQALRDVLADEGIVGAPELAARFQGGTLLIKPKDDSLQPRELPIEDFYKKIVRVRDQLRVLEQKINNNEKLDADDRRVFQGYITRSYGTLTTFNVLFQDKQDHFVGQRSK